MEDFKFIYIIVSTIIIFVMYIYNLYISNNRNIGKILSIYTEDNYYYITVEYKSNGIDDKEYKKITSTKTVKICNYTKNYGIPFKVGDNIIV